MAEKGKKGKPRTWLMLLVLVGLATILTAYSRISTARQIALATGPASEAQEEYFVSLVERPDLLTFFKSLEDQEKLALARNIGLHDHPRMAELIALLLADFDEAAREELTKSLSVIAAKQPNAVAKELKHAGGFQRLGVFSALRRLGEHSLPLATAQLMDGATRANAAAYLVEYGEASTRFLGSALGSHDVEVRKAAADALGKLRAAEAVPWLTALYNKAAGEEKIAYLGALAAIGAPASEPLLAAAVSDPTYTAPIRAQAALGLGRVGTPSAASLLAGLLEQPDSTITAAALNGLQLAGPIGLRARGLAPLQQVQVASAIPGPEADAALLNALVADDGTVRIAAARASGGRPAMAPRLASELRKLDLASEGRLADALVAALLTTEPGDELLSEFADDGLIGALVKRRREF